MRIKHDGANVQDNQQVNQIRGQMVQAGQLVAQVLADQIEQGAIKSDVVVAKKTGNHLEGKQPEQAKD